MSLQSMLAPLQETEIKMKIKVKADSHYAIFLTDLNRIQKEMQSVCASAMEELCIAEGLNKGEAGAQKCREMKATVDLQSTLLQHHLKGAQMATSRFHGILGEQPRK